MGNCINKVSDFLPNTLIPDLEFSGDDTPGELYGISVGIDYTCCGRKPGLPQWPKLYGCKAGYEWAAQKMQLAGAKYVKTLYNQQATRDAIIQAIREVGPMAGSGDTFLFYYTGHGDLLADQDGDEKDGQDEAFCTLGPDGEADPRDSYWLRDDDFADEVSSCVVEGCKILIIIDCCHSGTMSDLHKPIWSNHKVIEICGANDNESGLALPQMPIFTSCMIEALQKVANEEEVTVSHVYNTMLTIWKNHPNNSATTNYWIESRNIEPYEFLFPFK